MTTLFDRPDLLPATHVLVIGVGTYQYLEDPTRPRVQNLQLGQLTSPVASARYLTDWYLTEHRNDDVPLASVELLISGPDHRYRSPSGAIDVEVETATMPNVKRAWDAWYDRCNRHRDNIAIFFFSGHGILKTQLALLLEDFGENERRLFENAINLDATHNSMMTTCRARVQCFFADACRQVPYAVLDTEAVGGQVLDDNAVREFNADDAPRFYAAPPTGVAYGRTNKPTLFTQAVVEALRGTASSTSRGKWIVKSGGIQPGIRASIDRLQRGASHPEQQPMQSGQSSGTSVLNVLSGPPQVPVVISLKPAEAAEAAQLAIVSASDHQIRAARDHSAGDWELELPADDYDGTAIFPNREFANYSCRLHPQPPAAELEWNFRGARG